MKVSDQNDHASDQSGLKSDEESDQRNRQGDNKRKKNILKVIKVIKSVHNDQESDHKKVFTMIRKVIINKNVTN